MATVYLGRLSGPVGFARTVAIKSLHPQFVREDEVAKMFVDEARLAGRMRHPNIVPVIDVLSEGDELLLVMEYVHGETLARLALGGDKERIPLPIATAIVCGALHGLHAA